jgi:hypothetical protein
MTVSMKGKQMTIDIPKDNKPGEIFQFKYVASSKRSVTSTLPTVPGMVIVQPDLLSGDPSRIHIVLAVELMDSSRWVEWSES